MYMDEAASPEIFERLFSLSSLPSKTVYLAL